jgi:P-type Mg2+ transporter
VSRATAIPAPATETAGWQQADLAWAGRSEAEEVLRRLDSSPAGLSDEVAAARLREAGPNAIASHGTRPLAVLGRQFKNPLLILLGAAAVVAFVTGAHTDALIVIGISLLSVGLGFFNEWRSERAVEQLHSQITHRAVVLRGGRSQAVDVTQLVPGDVVLLDVGDIVPADVRLLEVHALQCDEAVLTGESMPRAKTAAAVASAQAVLKLPSCALMGTIARAGTARGVVVATGRRTEFGRVAQGLGRSQSETAFQIGLRQFSLLLVRVTTVLCASIFILNWAFGRHDFLDAALFALAIAVGLTPQLLPAIVTISLSVGAQRMARHSVLVKRLISIEDFGNIEILFTDKTGTLTQGSIRFQSALDPAGRAAPDILRAGLICNSAVVEGGAVVGGNPLDRALWEAPGALEAPPAGYRKLAESPFDYDRKLQSVLVEDGAGERTLITKGAPEAVFAACHSLPPTAQATLDGLFASGARVVAVGTRAAPGGESISAEDERDLALDGFLCFVDPAKPDAAVSLARLRRLGIEVKVVTGDNARVAEKLCDELALPRQGSLSGAELDALDDAQLAAALPGTTIFARVTPDQKARIIRAQRGLGSDVGFLGDGVNDAVALHDADVGISVDSASEVAKDAADIVLVEKDLDILADGVVEGRRIFSNTIKYVLMGTSSNFGNMFSAAGASLFLSFLPMTATQILLNNLLYDVSEMTIPTDNVDEELLARPAHWDIRFIRRFMMFFGPISSLFDFLTFGVMYWVFNARDGLFQSGWFVESLATQTLVIFVIRTRRVPFFHSRPSRPLLLTSLACVAVGAVAPFTPLGQWLFAFAPLPPAFFAILVLMVVTYLGLVELGKSRFFRPGGGAPLSADLEYTVRLMRRLAWRWTLRARPGRSA